MSESIGDEVEINCDCGNVHIGQIAGSEGSLLIWYCPIEDTNMTDVNT